MKNFSFSCNGVKLARFQAPPDEVDVKNGMVVAKEAIPKGTKYGPFLCKWTADVPLNPQFAWEVSIKYIILLLSFTLRRPF